MNTAEKRVLPAPPSLITALKAGFDVVTNHIELIVFPLALDLLLWLGPHLRLVTLIESLIEEFTNRPDMEAAETINTMQLSEDIWSAIAVRLNLFSFIRSYPVGIPSLMTSKQPIDAPHGELIMWEVTSLYAVFGLIIFFTIVGLFIGTLYFLLVSQASLSGKMKWREAFVRWPRASLQVFMLELFWLVILIGISILVSCVITIISLSGLAIGQLGILLLGGFVLWLLFPLLFSAHGIFVNQDKMWLSVRESVRLTRLTLPRTALFVLGVLLISEGLDLLWNIPEESSWLTVVGLAGHALVTSSLLAASFVYYQDAYRWVHWLLKQAKLSSTVVL
jgi:hypothetical protein